MPLVACSGCGYDQIVAAHLSGLKVTCERCKATFTANPNRRKEGKASWLVPPGEIGVGVLLTGAIATCVGLVILAFVLFREASKPPVAQTVPTSVDRAKPAERRAAPNTARSPKQGNATAREAEVAIDRQPVEPLQDANRLVYGLMAGVTLLAWAVLLFGVAAWVVKDCRNRSADSGLFWGILIVVFGLTTCLGGPFVLVLYLATRPNGQLVKCRGCGNRRLSFVTICPHCKRSVSKTDKTDDGLI